MSKGEYHFRTYIKSRYVSVYDYDKWLAEDPKIAYHNNFPKSYDGCSDVEVVWGMEIETRDWGIKNITPYIDGVTLSIFDEDDNELCIDTDGDDDWSFDWEWGSDDRDVVVPVTVMVDFKDKRIVLEF
tara:strand:- start:103 stop:486 length:384 start_codon:yes stop_codon:yes gene_type:complete